MGCVYVRGVPWYDLKHPDGAMQNMHGIVVGFNEAKEPLIGGLELKTAMTLEQIKLELVDSYNYEQTKEDVEWAYKFMGEEYLSPWHISKSLGNNPACEKFDKSDIFKKYTLDEVKDLGGCKVKNENSCRISPFVLGALLASPDPSEMRKNLLTAKSISLASQYLQTIKVPDEE